MNKKILCAIATVAMVVASAFSAFAAPAINEHEQAILNHAQGWIITAQSKGVITASYQGMLEQVRAHFKDNTDLTAEDAAVVKAKMDELANTYADVPNLAAKLNSGEINGLKDVATTMNMLSDVLRLQVAITADGSLQLLPKGITPPGGTGGTGGSGGVIKQTGVDMSSAVMMIAGAAGAIGACGFVAKKKKLF